MELLRSVFAPGRAAGRNRARAEPRNEHGGSIVEFAITLPLFMMVALGTITGGLVLHQKLQLTQATRDGARYGAAVAQNQTFVSGTWASNVRDLVVERSLGVVPVGQVCVALVSQSPAVVVGGTSQASYTTNARWSTIVPRSSALLARERLPSCMGQPSYLAVARDTRPTFMENANACRVPVLPLDTCTRRPGSALPSS